MSNSDEKPAKMEIRVGNLSFSAEGDQEWLGQQLNKVIAAVAPVISLRDSAGHDNSGGDINGNLKSDEKAPLASSSAYNGSLSAYLKAKDAMTKQVLRFLATAGWLHKRGATELTTPKVSAALSEHHQKKLTNPADCLNQNCSKGYCEKQRGGHFFITPEGWKALGEEG